MDEIKKTAEKPPWFNDVLPEAAVNIMWGDSANHPLWEKLTKQLLNSIPGSSQQIINGIHIAGKKILEIHMTTGCREPHVISSN